MSLRERERSETADEGPAETEQMPGDLLELLDAQYTQAILEAIRTDPKPAHALADETGASRPTVYRRLNSLQDAGLVETSMVYDADGHHRTVFEATLESVTVGVEADGVSVTVTRGGADQSSTRHGGPIPGQ